MPVVSAGLLMYRRRRGMTEVLLVHPGGPFWSRKDLGAWSIPKGECAAGEDLLLAARREFEEETGVRAEGIFSRLTPIRQAGGKVVHAWAFAGDCDAAAVKSNTFRLEWPPRSGRYEEFPEADRAEWFSLEAAGEKINRGQRALLEELSSILSRPPRAER